MSDRIIIRCDDPKVEFKIWILLLGIVVKMIDKVKVRTGTGFNAFIEDTREASQPRCLHMFILNNATTVECMRCGSQFALTQKRGFGKGGR
jgi:hypothetical protein